MTALPVLGDLAEFIRGVTFKPEQVTTADDSEAVACLRTKNVQAQLDTSDLVFVPRSVVKNKAQMVRHGDIVISSANSWNLVGKSSWVGDLDFEAAIGGFICLLRVTRNDVDARYLYRWFSSPRTQAIVRSFGQKTTNISNLNLGRALGLAVPLPSLPEQCRIAAILDQADDLCTKRRRALTRLDELADAVFSEFDDLAQSMRPAVSRDLSSITKGGRGIKAGPFGSSLRKADYSTHGYRVYGQEQVIAGDFSIGNYFVDEAKYRQLISNAVSPGDVLVSAVGTFGRIAIVPKSASPGIINPRLLKISPDLEQVTPHYLAALLRSQRLQREIQRRSHGGTMGIINASLLKDLPVSVPSMELQSKWGQVQSGIEKQIIAGLAASTQTEELFASLQHRAFRGEL